MKEVKMPRNDSDRIEYSEDLESSGLFFAYTRDNELIGVVIWGEHTGFVVETLSGGFKILERKDKEDDSMPALYERLQEKYPGAILKFEESVIYGL